MKREEKEVAVQTELLDEEDEEKVHNLKDDAGPVTAKFYTRITLVKPSLKPSPIGWLVGQSGKTLGTRSAVQIDFAKELFNPPQANGPFRTTFFAEN